MLAIYHRAASDLDVRALAHYHGETLGRNLATASLPGTAIAFGIVYAKWRSVVTASIVGAGLFLASLLSNIGFFRDIRRRENLKKDTNAVEVFEVSASCVLDLEPLADDAPAFCFFTGKGEALLLIGQWLLEYNSFPAESFRLYRWANTKKPIRIEVTGQPLEATPSTVRLRSSHRYRKIEVIKATPETLQDDLDRILVGGRDGGLPRY